MVTKRYSQLPVPTQAGRRSLEVPRPPVPHTASQPEDGDAAGENASPDWRWLANARCIERELDLESFSRTIIDSAARQEGRRGGSGAAEYAYLRTEDGSEYRVYDAFNNMVSGEKHDGAHVVTFEYDKALYYLYKEGPAR